MLKQLHQQDGSAAARAKTLAAVHAELESQKVKAESLDESSEVSGREAVAAKSFVEE